MAGKGKFNAETEDQHRLRFQIELEFVQCLANPNYIHFLAQRGYFKDSTFVNYVKYLLYWKEPEYARYLKYPMCLYFLDLLQYEHFRREAVNAQCCKFIDDQAILLWQHYTRRRNRMFTMSNGTIQMNPDTGPQPQSNPGGVLNTNNISNNSNQMGNVGNVANSNTNAQVTQNNGLGSNTGAQGQKVP